MVASSSIRFVEAALEATGDRALSYVHHGLKWLIRDHLLSLFDDFRTLSPGSDAFTHDDGTIVHLLHANGVLPVSSSLPPVLLKIWLHQAYPFVAPIVYVFPATHEGMVVHDHPFIAPSGAAVLPYLQAWQYPNSNLTDLARNLVKVFGICHPYGFIPPSPGRTDASLASKREAIDRLVAALHYDVKRFQAQIEEDKERLYNRQAKLRERAELIDRALGDLELEKLRSKEATKQMVDDADVLSNWLQSHGIESSLRMAEVEGFEAAGDSDRCLLENEAAANAIDDTVEVLAEALAAGSVSFGNYIKQVRCLAREQFFHRALVAKIQRSNGSLSQRAIC
ncbi:hypothetical protein OPV22_019091 [Ensete ventricosum]|uniref:UEV domain-containing protein n=1 Tax=Ensete ventricosum TaxID=4639 RepID=A0AAV8PJY0_ENSVE|nr:hypothetical protein OPV22_019091 [Ensete ventricosum]RWV79653.1 hypothetical protein GW17_00059182 [Ensete ventricosum]RWW54375.1 hypothetical protein BHE74_00039050 [Ensete ventricosum]